MRLLVVMRGLDPRPTAAQCRGLRRVLLNSLPPSFAESNALRIDGPTVRRLRIELPIRIATLDNAASTSEVVKQRLTGLFDTATGGPGGDDLSA